MALKTPVAFIIFNRPDLTARVFDSIRGAQPEMLFIIADGPRTPEERQKCDDTRRVVEAVDWKCEVRRNYSEINLGCRSRIASGLDWVFSQVSEAIILEDDCLPGRGFFGFCAELLDRYRAEQRVMHIGASNLLVNSNDRPYSYHFSRYAHIWGWATWARAWRHMDLALNTWKDFTASGIYELFSDPAERKYWNRKLHPISTGQRTDTWDYSWQYSVWASRGLCIVAEANLVSNIGFREDATHTRGESHRANWPTGELPLPLKHPPEMRVDEAADRRTFYEVLEGKRLLMRRSWRYRLFKPLRLWRKLRRPQVAPG